jgi:hypothetical protein
MKQPIRLVAFAALLLGTVSTASLAQQKQPPPAQPPTTTSPSTPAAPATKTPSTPSTPTPSDRSAMAPGSTKQAQAHSCTTTRPVGQSCTCADHPGKAGRVERPSGATSARCVMPQA